MPPTVMFIRVCMEKYTSSGFVVIMDRLDEKTTMAAAAYHRVHSSKSDFTSTHLDHGLLFNRSGPFSRLGRTLRACQVPTQADEECGLEARANGPDPRITTRAEIHWLVEMFIHFFLFFCKKIEREIEFVQV